MKLFLYHNGLCEPDQKIGCAKQFKTSNDLDEFLAFFCVSLDLKYIREWEAYATNDEITRIEVDMLVATGDNPNKKPGSIRQLDLIIVAREAYSVMGEVAKDKPKTREGPV